MKQYSLRIDDSAWRVSQAELVSVFHRGRVHALPSAGHQVAGLVRCEQGFFSLLASPACQSPATEVRIDHSLCALIRLSVGIVAVDIEQVQAMPAAGDNPALPSLVAHLDPLVATAFSPVALSLPEALPDRLPATPEAQHTFLVVRSGDATLALPASRVVRVGKHDGVYPAGAGRQQWVVRMDQDLLACASLGVLEQTGVGPAQEPWCIALEAGESCDGLLAEQVSGLIDVPATQVRLLAGEAEGSLWLALPGEGPIKVLGSPRSLMPDLASGLQRPGAAHAPVDRMLPVRGQALTLQLGPFRLVLPRQSIREVLGPIHLATVDRQRRRGALPVIDLRCALGVAGGEPGNFALELDMGGRRFIGLVDQAEMSASEPDFLPLPTLPAHLFACLDGLREVGRDRELRLRDHWPRSTAKALRQSLPDAAFLGWLPPSS